MHRLSAFILAHRSLPPEIFCSCRRCPPNSSTAHISEDKAHPEAASTVVKALDTEADLELLNSYTPESSIFGGYHGWFSKQVVEWPTFCKYGTGSQRTLFSASKLLIQLASSNTTRCSFPTNDQLLIVTARELSLYSPVHSSNALQLTAKFSLPALGILFAQKCIAFSPIPLHARTHNQIIAISIDVSGSPLATEPPSFTFYVKRNTHLELESTYTSRYGKASEGSSRLPWSNWGPSHTRSFQESSYDPCKHSVFGFRTVSSVGD